ncbi:TIGR03086 family metal-binding protein [Actinomycetospora termitidis]|uniref:TIGR03086 family metal-binding protein n=1 Tax=Actinomycetospora termitidis TaxID=3053470 RepID=A0ABT7M177_9PSEU|nr:TIGR03086 family metal-binding protein [Actinomycetospora sp. Odt1-22]MDL5154416.1 TIGR03086 family metal-binding protein [Actinomycetospora sp. Odt1-22]
MIDLTSACRSTGALIATLDDADLTRPTPCAEYDVAGLLVHLDLVAGGGVEDTDRADPRVGVPVALERLAVAWRDPAAWRGSTTAGVDLPNATWGRIALTEVVVHGWDLAQATGRTITFDDATLRATLEHVLDFVPRAPLPQLWGTPTALSDDAPLLDRVVAATGRRVDAM